MGRLSTTECTYLPTTSAGQGSLSTRRGWRNPQVGAAPSGKGGNKTHEMPPMCRQDLHKPGDAGTPGVARGAFCRPGRRQGGHLPYHPGTGMEVPVARPVRQALPPHPGSQQRSSPGAETGGGQRGSRGAVLQPTSGPSLWAWPPCGPPWEELPTPHGPGTTRGPGCPSGPRSDAGEEQLTQPGHSGRRPLAPLLEPAQRPRPTGRVPPGHTLTTPGAGRPYR